MLIYHLQSAMEPPLGAEPPSPQTSQSPMQEEAPKSSYMGPARVPSSLPDVDVSLPNVQESLPVADGSMPIVDDSLPIVDGSLPIADGSLPVDGSLSFVPIDNSALPGNASVPIFDEVLPTAQTEVQENPLQEQEVSVTSEEPLFNDHLSQEVSSPHVKVSEGLNSEDVKETVVGSSVADADSLASSVQKLELSFSEPEPFPPAVANKPVEEKPEDMMPPVVENSVASFPQETFTGKFR